MTDPGNTVWDLSSGLTLYEQEVSLSVPTVTYFFLK